MTTTAPAPAAPTCASCREPVTARRLCEDCTIHLRARLQRLAELWSEATVTVRRQDRVTRATVRTGEASTPWVMNPSAAQLLADLERVLRRWHQLLCHAPDRPVAAGAVIGALAGSAEYIARRTCASQLMRWVNSAIDQIAAMIDLPVERQWLGHCERCGRDLWAPEGEAYGKCICADSEPFLVDQQRRQMRERLLDKLLTASEAARMLTQYGARVGESTIHSWAKKQLLTSRGDGPNGRLYLVGDITALMDQAEARRRDDRSRS